MDDSDLISAARAGDADAYMNLYRRHSPAALRLARSLAGPSADAKDMVAQAFARVLAASSRGEGPDESFRPALLSAIAHSSSGAPHRMAPPVGDRTPSVGAESTPDVAPAPDPYRLVAAAFADLPERWQLVLWHTEVERERPADVARLLGIDARGVAPLVTRARSGLRERYRQAHLASSTDPACRPTVDRLPAYANHELSAEEAAQVRGHLDGCERCRCLAEELADGHPQFRTLLAVALLGGVAAAYLAAGGALAAIVAGTLAALRRIVRQRYVQVGAGAVAATAVVVLVLALASPPPDPDRPDEAAGTLLAPSGNGDASSTGPNDPATPPATDSPTGPPGPDGPPAGPPGPPGPDGSAGATGSAPDGQVMVDGAGPRPPIPGAAPPGTEPLAVTLEPVNALARGRPALLRLTVTNTLTAALTNVLITATVSLPPGVSLRHGNAGSGWTCTSAGSTVTCTRKGLGTRQTSKADLHVSVASDAVDGVPSVRVTGAGFPPVYAVASKGVVDKPGRGRGGKV